MTGDELIKELQQMATSDRSKKIVLMGRVESDKSTRGIAEFHHIERSDSLILLVTEEAFTVKT